MSLSKQDFPMLSDSEFKLLANTHSTKCNKHSIKENPYIDGYRSGRERVAGYKKLRKLGFINFDDSQITVDGSLLKSQDITLLIRC